MLKMIFALLEQYMHACKHNTHKWACTFLYLAMKVAWEGSMYIHNNFHTFKCCQDWAEDPQCRVKGPSKPPGVARI